MKSTPTFTGGCLCGDIQYEIKGNLGTIVHCHCQMCRKWHGSAFRTRATASKQAFKWTQGEGEALGRYQSSKNITRTFCKRCGSSLVNFYQNMPDLVGLALGTLNEDPGVRPEFHVYVGSKASWYEITDNLPQFEAFPQNPNEVYKLPSDS